MPTDMIGPQEDPYKTAAYHALDGDLKAAWDAVEAKVEEIAQGRYEPTVDADEDGPWSDEEGPAKSAVDNAVNDVAGAIGDAVWDIVTTEQGVPEEEAHGIAQGKHDELYNLWRDEKFIEHIVYDIIENHRDGVAYSRDPNAYHGVSNKDFM